MNSLFVKGSREKTRGLLEESKDREMRNKTDAKLKRMNWRKRRDIGTIRVESVSVE
ncbi:UNVERIFIED_CONTAM: hypothetical protein ABID98_001880 [Brevibacillus sp. OAP136]